MPDLPALNEIQSDDELKNCCAAIYESQWAQLLLGDSFHPGGLALTRRLGELLLLNHADRVLDIASGKGTSALFLAETFGCEVVGVDYGRHTATSAYETAKAAGLADRVRFETGDAENLPFADATFTAVICECAFCTFPNKKQAAAEMARVLKVNGRVGISDLTRKGPLPSELETLMAWIACIAAARPVETYKTYLSEAGFQISTVELHNGALNELVESVRGRLLAAELMVKLGKIELPNLDFAEAKKTACLAHETVSQGNLGYALLSGQIL